NVLKALRWYSKLLRLSVLPDLYSPAFSTLASSSAREKRESVPLPLVLHAFLEGQDLVPDCLFFHFSASGFAPASYAQTLCRLRQLLLEAAVPASQVGAYTLHSMKSTYLSWMAQLNLPLSARFLQGHHKIPGSAQLYSRDDIWPALRAQLLLWRSLHGGFRPLCPQHRGGQQPLAEPTVVLDKITWHVEPRRPTCFMLCDDSGTFLRMQASDKDLAE
ncbi:NLRC3, partial [Symbiodinium sp. KB8]